MSGSRTSSENSNPIEQDECLIRSICKLVYEKEKAIGMFLGAHEERNNDIGSVEFIGVIPKYRNKGHGLNILRVAILNLNRYGFDRYWDGTARNNTPMIKIFNAISRETRLIRKEDAD